MSNNPCKDCTQREIGCHANCNLYKQYKDEYEREKARISECRNKERLIKDYTISSYRRMQRKRK